MLVNHNTSDKLPTANTTEAKQTHTDRIDCEFNMIWYEKRRINPWQLCVKRQTTRITVLLYPLTPNNSSVFHNTWLTLRVPFGGASFFRHGFVHGCRSSNGKCNFDSWPVGRGSAENWWARQVRNRFLLEACCTMKNVVQKNRFWLRYH